MCWCRAASRLLHLLLVTNSHRKAETQLKTGILAQTSSFSTVTLMAQCKGTVCCLQKEGIVPCNFSCHTGKKHCCLTYKYHSFKCSLEVSCLIIYWICLKLLQKSLSSSQSKALCLKQLCTAGCSVILTC